MFTVNAIGGRARGPRISNVLGSLLLATFISSPVLAAQGDTWTDQLIDGITDGDFDLNLRYRYEWVDVDTHDKDANASTLRTRLLYKSKTVEGFFLTINMDDVRPIVADNFNDTRNGKTQYPVVADPKGTDLNLASISWVGIDDLTGVLGRQRIIRGNHRFIGNVGWRQNEQTYDSLSFAYSPIEKLDLFYAYVDRVKRIFGPNEGVPTSSFRSNSHLIDVAYTFGSALKLMGYGYLIELDNAQALSSQTLGLRGTGSFELSDSMKLAYVAEYAAQSDYGDNTNDYDAGYYVAEGAFSWNQFGVRAGYEVLEADGDTGLSFTTPLATLHKFNGWADIFLVTPGTGLEDAYVEANAKLLGGTWKLIYHDFSSNTGSTDFGSEIDFVASWKLNKNFSVLAKAAVYDSDAPESDCALGLANAWKCDTTKVWGMVTANF